MFALPSMARSANDVPEEEVARLLGVPSGRALADDARALVEAGRAWCARHARPRVRAERLRVTRLGESTTAWRSAHAAGEFESRDVARRLGDESAHALYAVAVTTGAELERKLERLADRPVEAAFLDRFAAAWTEWLVHEAGVALGETAAREGALLLPPRSPGREDWDLAEQARLLSAFGPGLVEPRLLPSGMLAPRHSVLTAFGLTRSATASGASVPCLDCSWSPCAFRRATRAGNVA